MAASRAMCRCRRTGPMDSARGRCIPTTARPAPARPLRAQAKSTTTSHLWRTPRLGDRFFLLPFQRQLCFRLRLRWNRRVVAELLLEWCERPRSLDRVEWHGATHPPLLAVYSSVLELCLVCSRPQRSPAEFVWLGATVPPRRRNLLTATASPRGCSRRRPTSDRGESLPSIQQ